MMPITTDFTPEQLEASFKAINAIIEAIMKKYSCSRQMAEFRLAMIVHAKVANYVLLATRGQ